MPTTTSAFAPRSYYPAIDGLRALAVTAVFSEHYFDPMVPWKLFWWGWAGVDLFFVISGFLITGILYDTLSNRHFFRNFYVRRTLRIFPIFYMVWIALYLLSLKYPVSWNRYFLYDVLYLQNFVAPWGVIHAHAQSLLIEFLIRPGHTPSADVAHFWSLCVEEQFYLAWPLVIWLVRKKKTLMMICGASIILVPFLRTYLYFHLSRPLIEAEILTSSIYTRFDTLLMGAWMALWLRSANTPSVATQKKVSYALVAIPFAVLAIGQSTIGLRWPLTVYHPMVCTYGYTLLGLISCGILLRCIDEQSRLAGLMQKRPLVHLGRISYGFYVYHYLWLLPWMGFAEKLRKHHHLNLAVPFLVYGLTYVVARLSFALVEKPFLRLKTHFSDNSHASAPIQVPSAF